MKISKIILVLVCSLFVLISCKNDKAAPEEVTVEYKEEKKPLIAENATLANAKFNIEGMTCAVGCAAKIEKSLAKMEGVASAKVDFESKTAVVSYDVDKITTDLLAERVSKTGSMYSVENMKTFSQCPKDCKKDCCKKEAKKCCDTKCSKECTEKDCAKCAAKKAECVKKCASKEGKACVAKSDTKCSKDCTDKSCEKCATKKAECAKTCAAKKSTCKEGCAKACCAKKE